ncbi:MAG TPA: D-alanyl-D-alanine carboxypeptidase/D-alanyl-D-alanine-endopeptidase [Brumimicrobium sp.]|nr:D-alanyl-D-alanine carboxypeptidase/D-alanyl-D-alanine-endopeptidase [Brumimicrobium sp.]
MKIIVVVTFYLFFTTLSIAQVGNNVIQQAINNFSGSAELESAAISFMAYDLDSNIVLAEQNPKSSLPPASVVKLFTTATAIEALGKDYRPKTEIYYTGAIDSLGVLYGDIVIRGLGDPSIGSRFFHEREEVDTFLNTWTDFIVKKGIKKIHGRVLADGSAFGYNGAPDGWSWSDMGNYYGAGASACAVYDNMTYLHFSTPNQLNVKTHLDSMTPPIPGLKLDNQVTTYNSSSDNAYIYGTPFSYQRFAIGKLPRNKSNFEVKASVPDPELLLAQVFQNSLIKAKIEVVFPAIGWRTIISEIDTVLNYKNMQLLFINEGQSVEELAYWTNMRSVNFFAEQLMCLVAFEKTGNGGTKESAKFMNEYWEPRLGLKVFQTDGSGLSRNNGFSANHFIQLLKYMKASKNFEDFEASLPVAGESGTLRGICRGQAAHGRVKAKSGTMNRIKSYAGYVQTKSGRNIAFAFIVNNADLTNYQITKRMETVFNAMANY